MPAYVLTAANHKTRVLVGSALAVFEWVVVRKDREHCVTEYWWRMEATLRNARAVRKRACRSYPLITLAAAAKRIDDKSVTPAILYIDSWPDSGFRLDSRCCASTATWRVGFTESARMWE